METVNQDHVRELFAATDAKGNSFTIFEKDGYYHSVGTGSVKFQFKAPTYDQVLKYTNEALQTHSGVRTSQLLTEA